MFRDAFWTALVTTERVIRCPNLTDHLRRKRGVQLFSMAPSGDVNLDKALAELGERSHTPSHYAVEGHHQG